MADVKYEPCPRCRELRKRDDPAVRYCGQCNGKGLVLTLYRCNVCAATIKTEHNVLGLPELVVEGAPESEHLLDCTRYKLSLCEMCIRRLLDQCAVSPEVSEYMDGTTWSYAEEHVAYQAQVERRKKERA